MSSTTTWLLDLAKAKGREYVTPEDVQDAVDAGVPRAELCIELLGIMGLRKPGLEDLRLCAFVAHHYQVGDSQKGGGA